MRAPPPSHESLLGAEKPCWWERTISCSPTVRSSPPPMRPGPFNFPKDCMCKQPVTERGREKNCAFPFFYRWTVHLETLNGQLLVAWSLESLEIFRVVCARVAVRSHVLGWICAMRQALSCHSKTSPTHPPPLCYETKSNIFLGPEHSPSNNWLYNSPAVLMLISRWIIEVIDLTHTHKYTTLRSCIIAKIIMLLFQKITLHSQCGSKSG